MSLHRDLAKVLEEHRFRDLTAGTAGLIRAGLASDTDDKLLDGRLVGALRDALASEAASVERGREADARIEENAQRLARENTVFALDLMLAKNRATSSDLSKRALGGLDRMGTGRRPTAAAVAGAGVGTGFVDRITIERAIEIKTVPTSIHIGQEGETK